MANQKTAKLVNRKLFLKAGEQYDFPLHGDSVRVTSAAVDVYFKTSDGALDFYLKAGEKADFSGHDFLTLIVYHLDGADQKVILSIGQDAEIGSATVSGNVSITGTPSVIISGNSRNAPLYVENGIASYGASFSSNLALAANTPETIFSPASNVNGAVLHSAGFAVFTAAALSANILAKTSAPTTPFDGDVVVTPNYDVASSIRVSKGILNNPIKIAAGKGLYFISNAAVTLNEGQRAALYTLL